MVLSIHGWEWAIKEKSKGEGQWGKKKVEEVIQSRQTAGSLGPAGALTLAWDGPWPPGPIALNLPCHVPSELYRH